MYNIQYMFALCVYNVFSNVLRDFAEDGWDFEEPPSDAEDSSEYDSSEEDADNAAAFFFD